MAPVVVVGQQPKPGMQAEGVGGDLGVQERGSAGHVDQAPLRVEDRQPTGIIGVEVQPALIQGERPRLTVVDARRESRGAHDCAVEGAAAGLTASASASCAGASAGGVLVARPPDVEGGSGWAEVLGTGDSTTESTGDARVNRELPRTQLSRRPRPGPAVSQHC